MQEEKKRKNKGDIFSHEGQEYFCLKPLEYAEGERKTPILNLDTKRPIKIETAIDRGLIEKCEHAKLPPKGKQPDLFANNESPSEQVGETSSNTYDTPAPVADYKYGIEPEGGQPPRTSRTSLEYGSGLFFLSADYIRVQHYLARGMIFPSAIEGSYGDEYEDLQSQAKTRLCLTTKPLRPNNRELTLEVFLTNDEFVESEKVQGCLLLSQPLPISRLKTIYVSCNKDELDNYIKGWILPDVPVPQHLFRTLSKSEETELGSDLKQTLQTVDDSAPGLFKDGWKRFDQMLGAMAYLRNVSRYYSESQKMYQDVSGLYTRIAGWLMDKGTPPEDNLIAAIFDEDQQNSLNDTERELFELLHPTGNAEKETIKQIAREQCANEKGNSLLRKVYKLALGEDEDYMGAVELLNGQELNLTAWIIVVLFHYRMKNSNDYRNIKQKIAVNWQNPKTAAKIMAFMGAYYGYAKLDAREYTTHSCHPEIAKAVERRPSIKYHLESLHERVLIETVFRHAFKLDKVIPQKLWDFYRQQGKNDVNSAIKPRPTPYLELEKLDECPYLSVTRLRVKPAYDFINESPPNTEKIHRLLDCLGDGEIKECAKYLVDKYSHGLLRQCLQTLLQKIDLREVVKQFNCNLLINLVKDLYEDNSTHVYMNMFDAALSKVTGQQG